MSAQRLVARTLPVSDQTGLQHARLPRRINNTRPVTPGQDTAAFKCSALVQLVLVEGSQTRTQWTPGFNVGAPHHEQNKKGGTKRSAPR